MRVPCAAALGLLSFVSCAAAEEPAPALPAPDPPTEARALLEKAARRQGTAERVGEKAVTRFLARFEEIHILDPEKGNFQLDRSMQAYAVPAPGGRYERVRSEGSADGELSILGHDGRVGWIRTKQGVREFRDPVKDAPDRRDLENRARMLRLALRVFFLGNLASDRVPVRLLPDEEAVLPVGREGKTRKVACRVLERAEDRTTGEPPLVVRLQASTLDPVSAWLPGAGKEDPGWLLVLDYGEDLKRKAGTVPEGMRVPAWIEMFEVPAGEDAKPVLRIQASVDGLEIDPEKVPDSLFAPPK